MSKQPETLQRRTGRRHWHLASLRFFVMLVITAAGAICCEIGFTQTTSDTDAVRAAADALDRYDSLPWYDAGQDRIQRIDVERPKDFENRHSRWQKKSTTWNWPDLSWLGPTLQIVLWVVFGLLLGLLAYAMVRVFLLHDLMSPVDGTNTRRIQTADADRVDSLPFHLARPQVDLLEETKRLYNDRRYGEAIVYLYSYQLIKLDQHHVIRLTRGKTNREYLWEVRRRSSLRDLLETTMLAFEDVFFGDHPLEQSRFDSCWNGLAEFHREIEAEATG